MTKQDLRFLQKGEIALKRTRTLFCLQLGEIGPEKDQDATAFQVLSSWEIGGGTEIRTID